MNRECENENIGKSLCMDAVFSMSVTDFGKFLINVVNDQDNIFINF